MAMAGQPLDKALPTLENTTITTAMPAYKRKCQGQTIRNPDTGIIQPVICQDGWEEWSGWERAAGVIASGMTIVQLIIFVVITGFLFQNLRTNFTYFPPGITTCSLSELYYGGRVALFFFVLINLTDLPFSLATGTRFWGAASFPVAVVTVFLNFLYVAVIYFYYGVSCNSSNNGAAYNICDNPVLCGIAEYMVISANQCNIVNPLNMTIYPPILLANVSWDPTFQAFFYMLLAYTVCGVVKSISIWLTPGSTMAMRKTLSAGLKALQQLKNIDQDNILTTVEKHLNDLKSFTKKLFDRMEFLDLLTVRHIVFYILAMALNGACFVYFYIWLGWYQQNSRAWENSFVPVTPGSYQYAEYLNVVAGPTIYLVYILTAFHVIPISLMLVRMGQVFSTEVAFVASGLGGILTFVQIFIVLLYFVITCNQDNSGYYNLCTDPLKLCSTYNQNPANNCPNSYSCLASYPPQAFQGAQNWSYDFKLLFIFLLLLLLTYIINCIVDWFLMRRFKLFTQPREKIFRDLQSSGGDDSVLFSPANDSLTGKPSDNDMRLENPSIAAAEINTDINRNEESNSDEENNSDDKNSDEEYNSDDKNSDENESSGEENLRRRRKYYPPRRLLEDEIYIHPVGKEPKIYKILDNKFILTGDDSMEFLSALFR